MRFALLGDHPDGLDMARALVESGRHELTVYSGPPVGAEHLRRWDIRPRLVGDLEEVLADPVVEAVLVAGGTADRPAQLRRALQSERHVLCVHPADQGPDIAYEAGMIQTDTRCLAVPLLPEALHPAVRRLAEIARAQRPLRLVEVERWAPEELLLEHESAGHKPSVPGWDVLRALGGEIAEVSAYSGPEDLLPEEPLLLAGQFTHGGLFRVALVPYHPEPRWRLAVLGRYDRAELVFPEGCPGPARLTWHDDSGAAHEEHWETWNPWPALVEAFEAALLARHPARARSAAARQPQLAARAAGGEAREAVTANPPERGEARPAAEAPPLTWQDEVRSLELDDAARRSVAKRRASALEHPEANEETGFKGTMTLVGCGLLWAGLVVLILSIWIPWLGWGILPVLTVFLTLQLLRWAVPPKEPEASAGSGEEAAKSGPSP
jgi:predicted dehydrogenase